MVRELLMERLVRDCLKHIDLLEGRLPMENADDEAFYKHSLLFGERVSCLLSLPSNSTIDSAGHTRIDSEGPMNQEAKP
jgi:hypothetical protein